MCVCVCVCVQDLVASFLCNCVAGWDQPDCTVETDECDNHSCQNGATCNVSLKPVSVNLSSSLIIHHRMSSMTFLVSALLAGLETSVLLTSMSVSSSPVRMEEPAM